MSKELCFVLMPFGKKPDAAGRLIDFNAVYEQVIRPAIEEAGLEPLRADEEEGGGLIHTPMFERLVLCSYAVADLTTANANVFYELGVRHAARPGATILLHGGTSRLPFDVQPLRALPYDLDAHGQPANAAALSASLAARLRLARESAHGKDSPLYQLLNDYPDIQHEKTDVFRRQVDRDRQRRDLLGKARRAGDAAAMAAVERELEPLHEAGAAVLTDLLLSYRDARAWAAMVSLAGRMPGPLAETVLVQEQLALALNRLAGVERQDGKPTVAAEHSARAEETLQELIDRRGPSSETYGILGRVYKDRWDAAVRAGDPLAATGHLEMAIDAYRRGFEADWRDAYPGVNAVTLMTIHGEQDEERDRLLPVVRYAVERRVARGKPDYWDRATLLELAVIGHDEKAAKSALGKALPLVRAPWEPETTAANVGFIRAAQESRGLPTGWVGEVQEVLLKKAKG